MLLCTVVLGGGGLYVKRFKLRRGESAILELHIIVVQTEVKTYLLKLGRRDSTRK